MDARRRSLAACPLVRCLVEDLWAECRQLMRALQSGRAQAQLVERGGLGVVVDRHVGRRAPERLVRAVHRAVRSSRRVHAAPGCRVCRCALRGVDDLDARDAGTGCPLVNSGDRAWLVRRVDRVHAVPRRRSPRGRPLEDSSRMRGGGRARHGPELFALGSPLAVVTCNRRGPAHVELSAVPTRLAPGRESQAASDSGQKTQLDRASLVLFRHPLEGPWTRFRID